MQSVLQTCGWWKALQADEAGAMALEVLRITPPEPQASAECVDAALWAGTRMDFERLFVLGESGARSPQLSTRLSGSGTSRHSAHEPDAGPTFCRRGAGRLRRSAFESVPGACRHLDSRAACRHRACPHATELESRLRASWRQALQAPAVEVLWRSSDDTGEHIAASPLVQVVAPATAVWQRCWRVTHAHPGRSCPRLCSRLSRTATAFRCVNYRPGAYEDLRTCPYRFFALRQLGLKTVDELEVRCGQAGLRALAACGAAGVSQRLADRAFERA